jgi:hypothetical protein
MFQVKHEFTFDQISNYQNVVRDLTHGADSLTTQDLPGLDMSNSPGMLKQSTAQSFTDILASFVKTGTIIGPLSTPPYPNLRINQLFTVNQGGKLRPILNLSAPKGLSYNDSIDKNLMPKIKMATARQIGQAIIKKPGCWMSKCDQISAYKAIPVKLDHLRLQGFRWLGKIFIEAYLVFGAASSVPKYDPFHVTVLDITQALAQPEQDSIFHCLDDAIFISSSKSENSHLVSTYRKVGKAINMSLAKESDQDKAFSTKQEGKILGVIFNTLDLTWRLDNTKVDKFSYTLQSVLEAGSVSQTSLMSALGTINTITIIARNLRFFKNPIIDDLGRSYYQDPLTITLETRLCLKNWLRVLQTLRTGLPLFLEPTLAPPLDSISFTTDAAGLKRGGTLKFRIGAGAVLTTYPHANTITCIRALWPTTFITDAIDEKNAYIGAKSTTLEILAIILPLYHFIDMIKGKFVLIQTDNQAAVWAFKDGRCPRDKWASLLLEAIMYVANSLPFQPLIIHTRRCSTKAAKWADTLSRSDKKGLDLTRRLRISEDLGWPPTLQEWMKDPYLDHTLPTNLLEDFLTKLGNTQHTSKSY